MKTAFWSLFAVTLVFLTACEERQVVIPDFVPPTSDRVVLLEELSGVRCPNCPGGSAEIKRLEERFGDNFVAVAYYTEFLGYPLPESKYNFLTEEAEEIEDYLGQYLGKPAASINRVVREDNTVFNTSTGEWSGFVEEALQSDSEINMQGSSNFDEDTRSAEVEILLTPVRDLEGDYRLTVLATESKIIDAQLLPQNVVDEDYEHNNIFREFLSNLTGDQINQSLEQSRTIRYDYSIEIEGEWVPENMQIVAFVEYQEGGRPVEVIQALEIPLVQ